ncbi:MAG: glycine cleavage system protein T, partial [Amylibacter sp.]
DIFINWKKDFVGKAAAEVEKVSGPDKRLVTMVIDVDGIDVSNDEAILVDGVAVGYVSSGGYAHHVKKSVAMSYVEAAHASVGTRVQVEILGQFYDAEIQGAPLYDANGANMRA